jgi:hypothetical protein
VAQEIAHVILNYKRYETMKDNGPTTIEEAVTQEKEADSLVRSWFADYKN